MKKLTNLSNLFGSLLFFGNRVVSSSSVRHGRSMWHCLRGQSRGLGKAGSVRGTEIQHCYHQETEYSPLAAKYIKTNHLDDKRLSPTGTKQYSCVSPEYNTPRTLIWKYSDGSFSINVANASKSSLGVFCTWRSKNPTFLLIKTFYFPHNLSLMTWPFPNSSFQPYYNYKFSLMDKVAHCAQFLRQ